MTELDMPTPEDIVKLVGWTVQSAEVLNGVNPGYILRITHPAASVPVQMTIFAHTQMVLSGQTVTAISQISIGLQDVR